MYDISNNISYYLLYYFGKLLLRKRGKNFYFYGIEFNF